MKHNYTVQISMGAAFMVIAFLFGKTWTASSWVTKVDMRLSRIEEKLGIPRPQSDQDPSGGSVLNSAEAGE